MSTTFWMAGEFEFIDLIRRKYSLRAVGDDCAVLPNDAESDLVVTADLLVEEVDFRFEWTSPQVLGRRSLAVSLSDIAAMGAEPVWAMLSLAVPDRVWHSGFVESFYEGWFELSGRYGVELVGGDVSRSPSGLMVDSIVGGEVLKGKSVLRSGAKPGDSIYVTGSIGGAAGGLELLRRGLRTDSKITPDQVGLINRQLSPEPQVMVGKWLNQNGIARSMIDISDGLSSDIRHICEASGVGATIYADGLPIDPNLYGDFDADRRLEFALSGGEDFELLFTAGEEQLSLPDGYPVAKIGEINSEKGTIRLIRNGNVEELPPGGFQHF